MHQLFREKLNLIESDNAFLREYLGDKVLECLIKHGVDCLNWAPQLMRAYRQLVTFWAENLPEADHVIRADAGNQEHPQSPKSGKLLMYFGLQSLSPGVRGQYLCVNYAQAGREKSFNLFIGGSTDETVLRQLVATEDPGGALNGCEFASLVEFEKIRSACKDVIGRQRKKLLHAKPYAIGGLCPVSCQKTWSVEAQVTESQAKDEHFNYWQSRRKTLDPAKVDEEQEKFREKDRARYWISVGYLRNGFAAADAYELALTADI